MTKLQKNILAFMALLLVVLLMVVFCVYQNRQPETIVGDFVAPTFDPSATTGTPENLDAARAYNSLELKENAVIALCANIVVEINAAQVYLTSQEGNQGWIKIKLMDEEGNLLGQSGLIRPGEYIPAVQLDSVPEESGLIVAKVLIYEPDTYLSLGSASIQAMLMV